MTKKHTKLPNMQRVKDLKLAKIMVIFHFVWLLWQLKGPIDL